MTGLSNLSVAGSITENYGSNTLYGETTIDNTLYVNGDINGSGNFILSNTNPLSYVSISPPLLLNGDLTVAGITNLQNNTTCRKTLTVTDTTSLVGALTTLSTATFNGAVQVNSPLRVGGVVTCGSSLNINGVTFSTTHNPIIYTSVPIPLGTADLLVVAGGGGASVGGGGAGEVIYGTGVALTAVTTYTITIGSGGSGSINSVMGVAGSNSVFTDAALLTLFTSSHS